jgi:coenzyme F420 hydrogenase subunit beta
MPWEWYSLFHHPAVGFYSYLALAFSQNAHIHANGASGGMVTAVLIYMLQKHIIDGAIVTIMGESPQYCENREELDNQALLARAVIAQSEDEIVRSQKSKYCPVPVGEILSSVKSESGRFAFVGLPCHIHALRKWQNIDSKMSEKIPYCFGLFCSRTPNFHATRHLLYNRKIALKDIEQLDYRAGEKNLGHMNIKLKNGKIKKIPHLSFDYWGYMFFKFFMPYRCYLCPDKLAALADVSFGDNWTEFWNHPKGTSTVVVREPKMLVMLQEMNQKRIICLRDINLQTLISSQDLANKAQIAPRKKICDIFSKPTPEYGNLHLYYDMRTKSFVTFVKALMLFTRCKLSNNNKNYYLLNLTGKLFFMSERIYTKIMRIPRIMFRILKEIFNILSCLIPVKTSASLKKSKYKMIMMGGYGSKDIGDEAMPHADILNLKEILGDDIEIVMLSPDPTYTEETHKQRSIKDISNLGFSPNKGITAKLGNIVKASYGLIFLLAAFLEKKGIHLKLWPTARNALNEMISSDIIFNVGGGNLNSVIPQELYKKGFIYLSARILHKPVIVSGQTIGPFQKSTDRFFGRLCLNTVHLLTFRDKETSHQRCLEIGVIKPMMYDAADDAMTIPTIEKETAEKILIKEVGKEWDELESELTVAMNFKGSLRLFKRRGEFSDVSKECQLMAEIADAIVDRFNAKVVFIPTDYCPGVDDRELHQEIINRVKNKKNIESFEGEYDDIILKTLIGLFDVAIGSRYHFCVFAASMLVPFVGIASGIYQQTKLKGLSDLCGLSQCFVKDDMEFATFESVWPKIVWTINSKTHVQERLKKIVPSLKKKSLCGVKEAVSLLQQK